MIHLASFRSGHRLACAPPIAIITIRRIAIITIRRIAIITIRRIAIITIRRIAIITIRRIAIITTTSGTDSRAPRWLASLANSLSLSLLHTDKLAIAGAAFYIFNPILTNITYSYEGNFIMGPVVCASIRPSVHPSAGALRPMRVRSSAVAAPCPLSRATMRHARRGAPAAASRFSRRLPDGVGTNTCLAEGPQIPCALPYFVLSAVLSARMLSHVATIYFPRKVYL